MCFRIKNLTKISIPSKINKFYLKPRSPHFLKWLSLIHLPHNKPISKLKTPKTLANKP